MRPNAIVSCLLLLFHNVCCTEDSWVEPHDWTKISLETTNRPTEDSCQCQAPSEKSLASIQDQLALIYFKKFVNSVFNRKKLQYGKTSQLYKRSLLFTLLPSEVEELETIQDVRDLDILLSKLLDKAKDMPLFSGSNNNDYSYAHQEMGVRALIKEMLKDFVQLLRVSEVKFMLMVLLAVAIVWFVRKRYRFPVVVIILGGIFIYGYFHTYLECNRKLEVDAMIEVIDNHQQHSDIADKSWFSRMFSYFSSESQEVQQKKKLIKSSKLNMPFCRPDHVFIIYTSDIFLKQIEMLLEKTTHTISSLSTGLSFPYNLIAPFALVFMIGYMLKLTFKYIISPKVWMGFVHRRSTPPVAGTQQAVLADEAAGDRLTGENLRMLLNVVHSSTLVQSQSQQQPQLAVSGVQDVLEPLEARPASPTNSSQNSKDNSIEKPNSSNISNEQLDVSSFSADIAQEAGFTVVDDDEDVDHIVTS
ncbi:uncharacterized protein LOC117792509 [Drosophila innubila]|uniref:uncharacterized protein LOC117792509 n=1 Tax=Drosophila innubila TaxID=198719 RepID=UPI00148E81BD|nr:uncharacterized protein LOC117792509 [Drosophila innubila]